MEFDYPEHEIEATLIQIRELTASFEDEVSSLYNSYLEDENASLFYGKYKKVSSKFESEVNIIMAGAFALICAAGAIDMTKVIFSLFKKSVGVYTKSAVSAYSTAILAISNKNALAIDEASIRASIDAELQASKNSISKFMLKRDDVVISVGKRSYKLGNYMNVVSNQEIRTKFSLNTLTYSKASGAIGIRVSNHNTICSKCALYEGKTFYFDKAPYVSELQNGIPPFHIGCKHFIVPVYDTEI